MGERGGVNQRKRFGKKRVVATIYAPQGEKGKAGGARG